MTSANPEQRAWQILVAAFLIFVALCGSTMYAIQWFIFQSTVPLSATLTVSRGTARLTVPNTEEALAVPDQRSDIEAGTAIQTDATSQATITFADPQTRLTLGTLVVFRDSQVLIGEITAPRFRLNQASFHIHLTIRAGRIQTLLLSGTERPLQVDMTTGQAFVTTDHPGSYFLDITAQRTRLTVAEGEASIGSRQSDQQTRLKSGNRANVEAGGKGVNSLSDESSLVDNGEFARPYSVGWKAYNQGNPAGSVYNSKLDGRDVAVIDRAQSRWPDLTLNHGETGLIQMVSADVSQFNLLELQVTLYIDEQNLSTCGVVGSECPLMVRLVYTDPAGTERVYIHGFYAYHDPGLGYPLLCDTCRAEHERINLTSWYTYSENLSALLPPEQRPVFLKELSLYASGHAYKVYISQIELLGVKQPPGP